MIAGIAFSIFIEVVHILYNYAYGMIAGLAFFNFYWGGLYFVQLLPMVWLLVWRFQFLLRWFIFCTMIAYGMIAGMAFSIFIEVVHILYNYAYGMIAGLAFFNFYWGGLYFVQLLPMVWLLVWRFQFLLRWFIFCTMIAYGMIAGMALSIFIESGLYFVQWLPMVWFLVWRFQFLLRWFIFCTMIAYGMIAGLAFFNFYWGGSYFVQWLPMVCR